MKKLNIIYLFPYNLMIFRLQYYKIIQLQSKVQTPPKQPPHQAVTDEMCSVKDYNNDNVFGRTQYCVIIIYIKSLSSYCLLLRVLDPEF